VVVINVNLAEGSLSRPARASLKERTDIVPGATPRTEERSHVSDVQRAPELPTFGLCDDQVGDRRVLDADTRQVGYRDFAVVRAPGLDAGRELAELRVHAVRREDAGRDGMVNLTETETLFETVRDDLVGPRE